MKNLLFLVVMFFAGAVNAQQILSDRNVRLVQMINQNGDTVTVLLEQNCSMGVTIMPQKAPAPVRYISDGYYNYNNYYGGYIVGGGYYGYGYNNCNDPFISIQVGGGVVGCGMGNGSTTVRPQKAGRNN